MYITVAAKALEQEGHFGLQAIARTTHKPTNSEQIRLINLKTSDWNMVECYEETEFRHKQDLQADTEWMWFLLEYER